jgi:hypothetical protein
MAKPCRPQMYVVVRADFSPIYKMVQGGHALAAHNMEYPDILSGVWKNEYLIYLEVFLEVNMSNLYDDLVSKGFKVAKFHEPDQRDQMTGIAIYEDGSGKVKKALEGIPTAK